MTTTDPMQPDITFLVDAHRYSYPAYELEVVAERFREDGGDLIAEITVTTARSPKPGLLFRGKVNLSSTRSQQDAVRALEKRDKESFLADVDFPGILQQIAYKSVDHWREGDPSIILADAELLPTRYLLKPFIQENAVNLIFGDGSASKSLLALAFGISVASGKEILGVKPMAQAPVLYLDWEDDAATHRERMEAICHTAGINLPRNLHYRRMQATMSEAAAAIRKEIAVTGARVTIIDSIGLAGGTKPEEAGTKITLFAAARSLRTSFLGIDHVSKMDIHKPYGSVYTRNIARNVWEVQKAQSEGSSRVTVALRNEKVNRGLLNPRMGFHIDYENEDRVDDVSGQQYMALVGVRFTSTDIAHTELVGTLHAIDQIEAWVKENGMATYKDICEGTGLKDATVRGTCNRYKKTRLINIGDKWGSRSLRVLDF